MPTVDNSIEDQAEQAASTPSSPVLTRDTVPLGMPLAWPIADADGTLLLDAGATLPGADELNFLFTHFQPRRADLLEAAAPAQADAAPRPDANVDLTLKDMHLEIGALIGVRSQLGSGARMHPCRIIGFAPNYSLFVTPPVQDGKKLQFGPGENIEIVAIASQAVFRFICTVESICRLPFDYVVLSRPGVIRRLRERKSIRVHAHLPVRFGKGEAGNAYEGLGLAKSISALGMSLTATSTLGAVGERLRVAFRLKSAALDTSIETTAVIRNVQPSATPSESTTHGLELDQLDTNQQMAMKVFVFDRQDDVLYWSNGLK